MKAITEEPRDYMALLSHAQDRLLGFAIGGLAETENGKALKNWLTEHDFTAKECGDSIFTIFIESLLADGFLCQIQLPDDGLIKSYDLMEIGLTEDVLQEQEDVFHAFVNHFLSILRAKFTVYFMSMRSTMTPSEIIEAFKQMIYVNVAEHIFSIDIPDWLAERMHPEDLAELLEKRVAVQLEYDANRHNTTIIASDRLKFVQVLREAFDDKGTLRVADQLEAEACIFTARDFEELEISETISKDDEEEEGLEKLLILFEDPSFVDRMLGFPGGQLPAIFNFGSPADA
ncbi:hypothetical protein HOG48_01120 [Candidatus Peregrinibacteria bacterium]|nr:hypothetical protein [Candidatus Peregrinibacteria bacterium]